MNAIIVLPHKSIHEMRRKTSFEAVIAEVKMGVMMWCTEVAARSPSSVAMSPSSFVQSLHFSRCANLKYHFCGMVGWWLLCSLKYMATSTLVACDFGTTTDSMIIQTKSYHLVRAGFRHVYMYSIKIIEN